MGKHLSSSPLPLLLSLIPNLIFSPFSSLLPLPLPLPLPLSSPTPTSHSHNPLVSIILHIPTPCTPPPFPLSLPPPSPLLLPPPSPLLSYTSSSFSLTRPRLGDSLSKVLAAGLVYFLFAFVDGIVRERSVSLRSFCSQQQ